jgi:hypothetical protein
MHERFHGLKSTKCFRKTLHWFGLSFITTTTTTSHLVHATSTSQLTTRGESWQEIKKE